jgi:DNA adenine methylase
MKNNRLYTPLRYPGGKARFSPLITEIIKNNELLGGHYLEVYAGGAGIALDLLFSNVVSHIHINDVDPAIHKFWSAIVNDTDNVLKLLFDTPINMDQWLHWRDVMNGKIECNDTSTGFATLFLNRTNRSGILKAGVIGGKKQSGKYTLDARFDKEKIASRIKKIALYKDRISVYDMDALELLEECKNILPSKSLIYLDPPYYVKGKGLYRNYYTHNDHLKIAEALQAKSFQYNWVLTYDHSPEILEMYKTCNQESYSLNYTAQRKYKGKEVMFFCDQIDIPNNRFFHIPHFKHN